ncbi:MAG: hypothetical protein HC850_16275 [Rhodomicrobium sp.]|nr:hypothetical protein [Rhodomicrobium sp.]
MTVELGATPGDHHFYIEFATRAPGVQIPDVLIDSYPERMTIVLQHQFENLVVRDDEFAVTLWFKGEESRLFIPFEAVTSFADPSVGFGLRFEAGPGDPKAPSPDEPPTQKAVKDEPAKPESGEVVSLDQFRKK